jgi:hypothetical protein
MAMLEHSRRRKIINSTASLSILAAAIVFVGLVFLTSRKLNGMTGTMLTQNVHLGPLDILAIEKESLVDGGYRIGFAFKGGMIGYIVLWCLIAVGVSYARIRRAEVGLQQSKAQR